MLVFLSAMARASVWEVGSGYEFSDIQEAFDDARVQSGDTLTLYGPGWTDSINANKSLILEAAAGQNVTLTSNSGNGFLDIDGVSVTLRGLTVDGNSTRALRADNGGTLTLEDVLVQNGQRTDENGAGIEVTGNSHLVLVRGELSNNSAERDDVFGNGGAISIGSGSTLVATATTFRNNTADEDGDCTLQDCWFIDNESGGSGGNGDGGAVLLSGAGSVQHSWFCNNVADQRGGAIGIAGSGIELGYNVFWYNDADEGGALWASASITLYNNDFIANSTNSEGASFFASNGTSNIWNSIAVDHTTGSAVFTKSGKAKATLHNTLGDGNNALLGGGATETGPSLTGDPLFVYRHPTDCEQSDLRLQSGSPAIGQGDVPTAQISAHSRASRSSQATASTLTATVRSCATRTTTQTDTDRIRSSKTTI